MKQLLNRYNPWWEDDNPFKVLINRKQVGGLINMIKHSENIIFLTGLRRVGKTSVMKLLIQKLIENENVNPLHILYVSVDDYLLNSYSIVDITEEFRRINRIKFEERLYLFFDEITYKEEYEIQLKNLSDSQNVRIIAASSNSLLVKHKKPYLTGRQLSIEIMPLDFEEYLHFQGISEKERDRHLFLSYFEDYLRTGGIPSYVLNNDFDYLRSLVDDIIYKDIAALHNIRDTNLLKDYFLLLMERAGKQLSINKIAAILSISADTARRYFEMFSESYLIHPISRHGKTNERILSPKKLYAPDLGIRNIFTGFKDLGSLFENYVYLRIKHLRPQYVYQNQVEIDFFTEGRILIEAKFHNEKLSEKQQEMFDKFVATKKIIVRNEKDILKILD